MSWSRMVKGTLTCGFTISARSRKWPNHALLTLLNENLVTFLACTGPIKTPLDVMFFTRREGNPRISLARTAGDCGCQLLALRSFGLLDRSNNRGEPLGITAMAIKPGAFRTDSARSSFVPKPTIITDYAGRISTPRWSHPTGDLARAADGVFTVRESGLPRSVRIKHRRGAGVQDYARVQTCLGRGMGYRYRRHLFLELNQRRWSCADITQSTVCLVQGASDLLLGAIG